MIKSKRNIIVCSIVLITIVTITLMVIVNKSKDVKSNNIVKLETNKKVIKEKKLNNEEPAYYEEHRKLSKKMTNYLNEKYEKYVAGKCEWPLHGLFFINGKVAFIHPALLNGNSFVLTHSYVKKHPSYKKFHTAVVDFMEKENGAIIIFLIDSFNRNIFETDLENITELFYKIEDNKMYVSKDEKTWSRLYISGVNLKPKDKELHVKFYLKCKYFQGEYGIYRHP